MQAPQSQMSIIDQSTATVKEYHRVKQRNEQLISHFYSLAENLE